MTRRATLRGAVSHRHALSLRVGKTVVRTSDEENLPLVIAIFRELCVAHDDYSLDDLPDGCRNSRIADHAQYF
jgi:hypothetical protein